jgi:acyl-CoA reductase-like NAD-dependent aldehyde dehydrogenase
MAMDKQRMAKAGMQIVQLLGVVGTNSEERTMETNDAVSGDGERKDKSEMAKVENGFYNVIDGQEEFSGEGLSVIDPGTGKQLAVIPYANRAFLNKAISDARNAFSEWATVRFERRKAILASLLNKIGEHVEELSALLAAEQGGPLVQARWEIELLTKAFGPVLMQMEVQEKEQDVLFIQQMTKRYVPIDGGAINQWNLPVILSFGKVLPALLTGDTVVLRPSPFNPLTVLRISEFIRESFPLGVFNVVVGGYDLWPWTTWHSGIDLIVFTRNVGKPVMKSAPERLEPFTFELAGSGSKRIVNASQEKSAVFGSIALGPITWNPGRYGLARTLFEILSFQPGSMRAQVLVWSLARKASYSFPMPQIS